MQNKQASGTIFKFSHVTKTKVTILANQNTKLKTAQ